MACFSSQVVSLLCERACRGPHSSHQWPSVNQWVIALSPSHHVSTGCKIMHQLTQSATVDLSICTTLLLLVEALLPLWQAKCLFL